MFRSAFGSLLVACAVLPAAAQAQPVFGSHPTVGYTHNGYPYGPRVAPPWGYPGLGDGPFVTYPFGYPGLTHPGFGHRGYAPYPGYGDPRVDDGYPFGGYGYPYGGYGPRIGVGIGVGAGYPGFGYGFGGYPGFGYGRFGYPGFGYPGFGYFGYSGRAGSSWSNGLSLYGPPVPVYGPIPGVFGANDLNRQWRSTLAPGFAGYGWFGLYAASPRPHHRSVSVYPQVEPLYPGPAAPQPAGPANAGGCMLISVTVPQPAAEVFVDGQKTGQTGTDRTFESPPLEVGKTYRYTVTARWVSGGKTVEMSKDVTGTAGEVVRVDFGR
jgi:uncharacterized protein (TIGR03000 family)